MSDLTLTTTTKNVRYSVIEDQKVFSTRMSLHWRTFDIWCVKNARADVILFWPVIRLRHLHPGRPRGLLPEWRKRPDGMRAIPVCLRWVPTCAKYRKYPFKKIRRPDLYEFFFFFFFYKSCEKYQKLASKLSYFLDPFKQDHFLAALLRFSIHLNLHAAFDTLLNPNHFEEPYECYNFSEPFEAYHFLAFSEPYHSVAPLWINPCSFFGTRLNHTILPKHFHTYYFLGYPSFWTNFDLF